MDVSSDMEKDQIEKIAEEAYGFAFPMMMGYRFGFASFMVPGLPSYRGPLNRILGEAVTLDYAAGDRAKQLISCE
jgi:hypothetical protein